MSIPFTLNLIQGSVAFRFTPEAANALKADIAVLMESMKAIAGNANSGSRPEQKQSMEYQHTGDVFLEIFCNPNIYPSPFAAKVLVTLRDDRIRLTSEAELPRLMEDLDNYLAQT
ncbi:MAG: hypothetical protein WBB82_00500 [Limnothrix sp.]